jgi:SEC-C motif-containing protein
VTAEFDVAVDGATITGLLTGSQEPSDDTISFLVDALASASDDALDHLSREVECHTAGGGDVEPLLRSLRAQARGKHAKAAVELLAARAAEGTGNSESAKDLTNEALAIRPDLEPALHDAAEYAATRGDYAAADGYIRAASQPDPLAPGLAEILTATDAEAPRNKPCPCGSGRKFKACCRGRTAPALSTRARLLYALLGTYAERGPGVEVIRPLAGRTAFPGRYAMFCLDLALFHGGLVDRFLAARGHWLRDDERELVDRWRAIPFSVYEPIDVTRGKGLTLRRLPDGPPIRLIDRALSTSVTRLGLLCGRILNDGDQPRILALPVPVPRYRRQELVALLETEPSTEQIADFFAPEPAVQVQNMDGEDAHNCRVTYRVPNPQVVFDRLAEQLTYTDNDLLAQLRPLPDGRTLNLGEILCKPARFTVTANSPTRLAEIEGILRTAAPAAVELDRHIERMCPEPDGRTGRRVIIETYFVDSDQAASEDGVARSAETGWLDTPGVIGDLSPRDAAATGNLAELRATINDIEYIMLEAKRDRRPTDGLMDADRLRAALQLEES